LHLFSEKIAEKYLEARSGSLAMAKYPTYHFVLVADINHDCVYLVTFLRYSTSSALEIWVTDHSR